MIIEFLKKALPFFGKSERFLVVEILDYFLRVSSLKVDFDNKKIHLVKTLSVKNSFDDYYGTFEKLSKLLKQFGNPSSYSLILNLDSSIATTIHSAVSLIRNHPKEPIDEADLDNLISQAIWKMFERFRAKVALKMAASDLDILLTDIQIKHVKLDGHKVINPIGFQAKTVEIGLAQTFVTRELINHLKPLLPKAKIVLINEAGTVWANVVSQNGEASNFLFVNLFPHETTVFLGFGSSLLYLKTLDWGEKDLIKSIAENLAVSQNVANEILDRFVLNDVSEVFGKRISKILNNEFQALTKSLEPQLKKHDVRIVYCLPFFTLPEMFFLSGFKSRFHRTVKITEVTTDFLRKKFNFGVKFKRPFNEKSLFPILAGLFQFYFLPADDKIRKMAKRRIRWLAPD